MPGRSSHARTRRPGLGQHFLASHRLAARFVEDAQIDGSHGVVELGAGTGTLTDALARRAAHVLAVEVDHNLVARLVERFASSHGVTVVLGDALTIPLPATPYRVVANPPFQQTAALLRRLLEPAGAMTRADLIVQWQVARARMRVSVAPPLDLLGATWGPWWVFERGRRLPANLFRPPPSVDAAVLIATRRSEPLLPRSDWSSYRDFVRRGFGHPRIGSLLTDLGDRRSAQRLCRRTDVPTDSQPGDLKLDQWVALFTATSQDHRRP